MDIAITDAIAAFRNAMMDGGVNPPSDITADGELHRFATNGRASDRAGFYVLHCDQIPAGLFGCWRDGIESTWRFDLGRKFSREESASHRLTILELRKKRDAERTKEQESARKRSHRIWNAAKPAPDDHPYLIAKKIKPHCARLHQSNLIIRKLDTAGQIHSLQNITPEGDKFFTTGGATKGLYFPIGSKLDLFCFAEGFATASSVHQATGHTAIVCFSAGNIKAVTGALRKKYPDATFLICADNDAIGIEKANEAGRLVNARVIYPPEPGQDFNDVAVEQGKDAVAALINGDAQDAEPPEKKPLQREIEPPGVFPVDALGEVLAPMAKAVQHATRAPMALCGSSVLAAAALVKQGFANVWIDGRTYPISLYFLTLGGSGERKSEVDRLALGPVYERQKKMAEKFVEDLKEFEADSEVYSKSKAQAMQGKDKSLQERRKAVDELGPAPERPLEPILICGEPTYEGLVKLLSKGQPAVGLFSDEGAQFIGGHGMSGDQQVKTAAGLSSLWDGKPISRVRAGDGASVLYGRRLSIHLMAQPEIAAIMLSNELLSKQGFLARMLLSWPDSTIGIRLYQSVDIMKDAAVIEYNKAISKILETPYNTADDIPNELNPRLLKLNDEAKTTWITLHDEIEVQLGRGELSAIRAHGAKAAENIARVAAVLALVRDFDREYIDNDCILNAAQIVAYYLNEALRLESAKLADPDLEKAQKVIEWCREYGKSEITLVELYKWGPNAIRKANTARSVMEILVDHGWAEPLPNGAIFENTHRAEAWKLYL